MVDYSALYRMVPFDTSAPRADFYTPLANIARAITTNRISAQNDALRERALALQEQQAKSLEGYRGASLAESARHNKAVEAIQSADQGKPVVVPFGAGLYSRSGDVIREPGLGETGSFDDATLEQLAKQAIAGDTSVFTNLGRGSQGAANVVAIRKKIAEINARGGETGSEQAMRNAEFFGTKAGQRTLGARSANIELAATEFGQVLPVVQQASQAVDRTRYPDLNKIIQAYQEKTGDPNIVAFGGGVNTLVNLYARAISPTGVPTVSDKDHAREILSKAWSQGQFDAAVGMMSQEIQAALTSPEKVRDEMRRRFLGGSGGSTWQSAPSSQPAAVQEGATATNPKTGQKIQFRGGRWVPVQ